MASKRRRRLFSAAESAEVWDRWQRGDGLKLIGRVFDRSSGAIFEHLRPHGGIRPAPRRRSRRVLGLAEREEISRGVAAGASLRSIAGSLGRAASTISRELRRNGGHRYRAAAADQRAWDRALRRLKRQWKADIGVLPVWGLGAFSSASIDSRNLLPWVES
jgi:DNA-binding CsgD family transcriptional regulator